MRIKFLLLCFITLSGANNMLGQSADWVWAKNAGANVSEGEELFPLTTDASNNVYVAGVFQSDSVVFGATTLSISSAGSVDMFLVKYDDNGNVSWARSAGSNIFPSSIAVDASENVYVAGVFVDSSISFGAYTLINDSAGMFDMYIVKYDRNGNIVWAKEAGGKGNDFANSLTLDKVGDVYITGTFAGNSIQFGSFNLNNNSVEGGSDIFVTKYDSTGAVVWAKGAGGSLNDYSLSITVDVSGNIYVTGSFSSYSLSFGSIRLIGSGAGTDMFVVRYNSSGEAIWAKNTGYAVGYSVTTDAGGNAFVAGSYSGSVSFDNYNLSNGGLFLTKYDTSGKVTSAKAAYGMVGYNISAAVNTSGNVFVTGSFTSDTLSIDNQILIKDAGASDEFIIEYDNNCNGLWGTTIGDTSLAVANFISVNPSGEIYVTGWFNSQSIAFGNTTLEEGPNDAGDMFLAKLSDVTGIHEVKRGNNDINIFPNPSAVHSTLTLNKTIEEGNIEIYNSLGEQIYNSMIENFSSFQLDSPPGIYLVRIESKGNLYNEKIIVQ